MVEPHQYVFSPSPIPSVEIVGSSKLFPVRRIFCVGRNYQEHAIEMGVDPIRDPPFFFTKPADAVIASGSTVRYPSLTRDFQHEIELVVAIASPGRDVTPADAPKLVFGHAVGIDLTRRDLQMHARKAGLPWDMGKGFDDSAVCTAITPVSDTGKLTCGRIWLAVNGTLRQESDLSKLIWSVPEVLSILSRAVELRPGDLVFTGTPAGVGPLAVGDQVTGGIERLQDMRIAIGSP